jgi:serine/threonine-protein kinase
MPAHAAAVCEGDIEPASARVLRPEVIDTDAHERTLDPVPLARARQTTPQRLSRQLRGDIDAILEVALRPEPPRRYGSAELLAQDVERHLSNRPVFAHRGSRGYAFAKLIRRHRLSAAAIVMTFAAVLFGAGAAAWQAAVAGRERQRAEVALRDTESAAEFLVGLFDGGAQSPQSVAVGDLLQRGMSRIDQLSSQPDVQARVLGAMAAIHESIGEYEQGQRAAEQALALLRQEAKEESAAGARLLVQYGTLLRHRGEYDSAQATFVRARAIQERVLEPTDPELSVTLQRLAGIAIYLGEFAEAERRARAALDLQLRTLGAAHRMRVNMLAQLGAIQRARGDRAGAERTLREAVALRPRATGSTRHEILNDRFQLATVVFADAARADEAEALFRAELPLLDADSPDDLFFVTWAYNSIAELLARRGDLAGSEQLRRQVLELRRGRLGQDHPATGESTLALGEILQRQGRREEARQLIAEGARIQRRALGERHPMYAAALMVLSDVLISLDDLPAADSAVVVALAIRGERYGTQSHGYIQALRTHALIQTRMGAYATAEALLLDGLRLAEDGGIDGARQGLHETFVELYTAWGRPRDAAHHRQLAAGG